MYPIQISITKHYYFITFSFRKDIFNFGYKKTDDGGVCVTSGEERNNRVK